MEIQIFGKDGCERCEQAKKKVGFLVEKWGVGAQVPVTFFDMDTVAGRAEGAFYDVVDIPTTLVLEGDDEAGRWNGAVPESDDLRRALRLTT